MGHFQLPQAFRCRGFSLQRQALQSTGASCHPHLTEAIQPPAKPIPPTHFTPSLPTDSSPGPCRCYPFRRAVYCDSPSICANYHCRRLRDRLVANDFNSHDDHPRRHADHETLPRFPPSTTSCARPNETPNSLPHDPPSHSLAWRELARNGHIARKSLLRTRL